MSTKNKARGATQANHQTSRSTNSSKNREGLRHVLDYMPDHLRGKSAEAQRARLLKYLKEHRSITTLQARRLLDVLHCAGRILELRADGYSILTNWRHDVTSEGKTHRVAEYVLLPKRQKKAA